MVMICFNFVLIWFAAMEFFSYQPEGLGTLENQVAGYPSAFDFTDFFGAGFLVVALSALASIVVARFTRINGVAMFLFVNIFWIPYLATVQVFDNALRDTPVAFQGIMIIFTAIMTFVFAIALIQMSNASAVSG